MSDIVKRLRAYRPVYGWPEERAITIVPTLGEAAADEIDRLRAGGCARDQTTTQYCVEAARLAADNDRLRAALGEIRDRHVPDQPSCLDITEADYIRRHHTDLRRIARAALAQEQQ